MSAVEVKRERHTLASTTIHSSMPDRPPSLTSGPASPTIAPSSDPDHEERMLATTTQVVAALESAVGVTIPEDTLETLLLEFDRRGYLEWVTLTSTGDYVWDLTDAANRIADAVAAVLVDAVTAWIGSEPDRER